MHLVENHPMNINANFGSNCFAGYAEDETIFFCHDSQTKRQIGKILANLKCPYPSNISIK